MTADPLVLIAIGLLAGVIASLLGLGGGMLMTPFLAGLGLPLPLVVPTSTCAIAGTAAMTGLLNWRQRNGGDLRLAVLITLAMVPALEASTWINRWLRGLSPVLADGLIGGLFIVMMAWSLYAVLRPGKPMAGPDPWPGPGMRLGDGRRCSLARLGLGGSAAGLMGGLLGVGGGRVLVPLFSGPLGLDIKAAIATSSLCILFSSCYSTASFGAKGLVEWPVAAWLLAGSLPGAWLGSLALARVDRERLRRTFAGLSIAAMAAMALAPFGWRRTALAILVCACAWVGWVALRSVLRPAVVPAPTGA
jgi:uncharacterized membrane protein YfcA